MSTFGWRLLTVLAAFLTALVLPLFALVVVTGLVRTGLPGLVAVAALTCSLVLLVKIGRGLRSRH